jgi:1,2-diacylglycerol 3-beta-glucosyltransferase
MRAAELIFALLMLVPLLFFAGCVLYLLRLLFHAALWRNRLASLALEAEEKRRPGEQETNQGNASIAPTPSSLLPAPYFVLLIPAHNEELVIASALQSLKVLDYPEERFAVVVIADNCTDRTVELTRASGVIVLERFHKTLRGKGYALEWALNQPLPPYDALVILDADTKVAPNLLQEFARGLMNGQTAMQARYEVLNAEESWRTKLMACALALAHIVKPLGREKLGLSDGLKGNGMCFARALVEQVPWSGESITEDIEYTLRLCRAGHRVTFLPQTAVWAQMPTTGAQAASQRKRWEGGRYRLMTQTAPALIREGLAKRNVRLIDRALEIVIPPFAEMFALPVLFGGICAALGWGLGWQSAKLFSLGWLLILLAQCIYLVGGMWTARVPAAMALVLLRAPFYIVWKFGLYAVMAVTRSSGGWKRTERREL